MIKFNWYVFRWLNYTSILRQGNWVLDSKNESWTEPVSRSEKWVWMKSVSGPRNRLKNRDKNRSFFQVYIISRFSNRVIHLGCGDRLKNGLKSESLSTRKFKFFKKKSWISRILTESGKNDSRMGYSLAIGKELEISHCFH